MGLADAAVLVTHHEAEANNAGGAHLAVPARPVGNPLQRIGAHRAAVVHLRRAAEIGGGGEGGLGCGRREGGEKVRVGEAVRLLF